MILVPQMPWKVQYLLRFSFPLVKKLCEKTYFEKFIGGRKGYDKEMLFGWLLIKKVTNWDYRSIAEVTGISYQTLSRRNKQFQQKHIYQKFFRHLVKKAVALRLIKGEKVAIDSSFVKSYSGKEEMGTCGYNGHKKAYGFKLHALIDVVTQFPIALVVTNGLMYDGHLAIPLMKRGRKYLKKNGYILADKAYDDTTLIAWIIKAFQSKAGIPMRKKSKLAKGKKNRYGNLTNWRLKAVGRTFKKSILNLRTEIERFFASIKGRFHLGKEQTRGIEAFTRNAYLSLISYCLTKFYLVGIRSF